VAAPRLLYNRPVTHLAGSLAFVFVLAGVIGCGGAPAPVKPPAPRPVPVFPGLDIADAVALGMVDGPNTAQLTVVDHLPMFFIGPRRADPMSKDALRAEIDAVLAAAR
jgi:hypothetical protein